MTEQEWAFVKKSGTAEFSSSLYAQGLLRKEAFFINCLNAPSGKYLAMKNYQKYSKQYFAPNGVTMDWTKKSSIETPPVWCSVDLRDGNQALIVPMTLEEKVEFFQSTLT